LASTVFFDEAFEKDVADLAAAQSDASLEGLFNEMRCHLDPEGTLDYWSERKWRRDDPKCLFEQESLVKAK